MPITSIGTHITTASNLISHWKNVNIDRIAKGMAELLLHGGYSLDDFLADQEVLQQSIILVVNWRQERALAADDRDTSKQDLAKRLQQFRSALRVHMQGTRYERVAPIMPQSGRAESKFLRPLVDAAALWEEINAATDIPGFTPPLILRGGYTLAALLADLQSMRDAFAAVTAAENGQLMARRQRNDLLGPFRKRMLQYRAAIALEYSPGHPFYESLPRVSRRGGKAKAAETQAAASQ